MHRRDITSWFWLVTDVALTNYMFVERDFFKVALMLCVAHISALASFGSFSLFSAQA